MGGLGVSFLVRRARSSWLLLACVAVMVLVATGLATVLWTFAAGAVPAGALSSLAALQVRLVALSGLADAGKAASDSQVIRATLGKAWPGVGFQMESALWADPVQLSATSRIVCLVARCGGPGGPPATSTTTVQIQPAWLEGISAQATLTAGAWPGPPHHGPSAARGTAGRRGQAAARDRGLGADGHPQSGGAPTSLQVTGLFRPTNPASPYWALDLLPISGISIQGSSIGYAGLSVGASSVSFGPAVVNPAAFGGALTAGQGSWMVLPQAPAMARENIAALAASTSEAVSQLTVSILPYGLKVTSGLPQLLDGMASTIVLTRSLFTIAALLLLLVAGAGLVLAARLLASLREEESALLRARGATRWQVVRPVLAEAMVLGAAAGLAGVLAGTHLTGALARLADLRIGGYTGRGITSLAWLSALAVLVVCVAVMAWPALHTLTPDAARLRRGRQARLAAIAWAGGDLALLALAAVAVWELRGYSAVAHPATGSLGIDPVVALAPALALAGVALIPLRGLPLLARLADRAADNERRLAAAMVSWQIARRPIRQAGPVLLVVIATATTTLALAGYASWRQSTADQAAFAVGSDVRVDSAGPPPLGAAGAIIRAPGVTAATEASLAGIGNGGQLIALDASTASKTILLAASVAFGLLVFASVLASLAIPRESAGLSNGALQRVIAASQPADRTVIGTTGETSMTDETGQVQAPDIAAAGASLRARLAAGGMTVASDPPAWASLTTGFVPVSGAARAAGYGPPQFAMTYRTALARYSQIVAGRLPAGGPAAGQQAVVQAAVTTATAARFGLRVGTRVNAGPVQLVVTGIIRPANPAATFWSQDPVAARPVLTPAASPQLPYWVGAVFTGPGALPLVESGLGSVEMQVTWVYTAALGGLTAGQVSGLEANVNSLVASGATVMTPGREPGHGDDVLPDSLDPVAVHRRGKRCRPGARAAVRQPGRPGGGGGAARRPAGGPAPRRGVHAHASPGRGAVPARLAGAAGQRGHRRGRRGAGRGTRHRPDPRRRRRGGLVAGRPHDRRDAHRPGADQRDPAARGGACHRPGRATGRRPQARGPADRGGDRAGRRGHRRAGRAPEPGPELREQRPVHERGAGARRDPRGRRPAALLPCSSPANWPGSRAAPAGWSRSWA